MNPAAVQSFDQCRLQRGGTEPPIIAHSDPASACPRDQRAEAPANRIGVLFGECFTDNAANIIFTQGGRVEVMGHALSFLLLMRLLVRQSGRSEEHTSELQSLMRISYAVFCLKKKKKTHLSLQNITYSI